MRVRTYRTLARLLVVLLMVCLGTDYGTAQNKKAAQRPAMGPGAQTPDAGRMRAMTNAQRTAAAKRAAAARAAAGIVRQYPAINTQKKRGAQTNALTRNSVNAITKAGAGGAYTPPPPLLPPDYFGVANYANSPLPAGSVASLTLNDGGSGYSNNPTVTITDLTAAGTGGTGAIATATVVGGVITGLNLVNGGTGYIAPQVTITDATGTGADASASIGGAMTGGIHKFVDDLPGLCPVVPKNGLGQCIPVAQKDIASFPGSDYYRLALRDSTQQMHSDLPATTKFRGYVQVDANGNPVPVTDVLGNTVNSQQYLGPLIIATRNHPVRVKFFNQLCNSNQPCPNLPGGVADSADLFIPTDPTYMGAGLGPDGVSWYTQNRATIHLHGGTTPWITDGTPHQWITPPGENTPYPKGESFQNVPDMIAGPNCAADPAAASECITPDPYDGIGTFYWTNQQSGRLLFYHEHAYGITRLNVYVGQAAGYLIVDPDEENLLAAGTAPGTLGTAQDLTHLVPLIIQDRTFVPSDSQMAAEDPTWDPTLYGGYGNLWYPHVYLPNQNPVDPYGANPYGRWDYGPWFWPPQTSLTAANPPTAVTVPCTSSAYPGIPMDCPITPNPSGTPEAFMDTPVINGTAYPVMHVGPAAYRFQILNAANDRSWSLQLYKADPLNNKEVVMVPAVAPSAGSAIPPCTTPIPITNRTLGIGLASSLVDAGGNILNGTGLPLNCWPSTWPTDGRDGGVPDPRTAGPAIVEIGTEAGPLATPVAIPSTPTGYEYGRRSITVLNVATHGLWLGPAERADVIVDFSGYPNGTTFILYNDAPAPAPAFDTRIDYYTGDPDQTSSGGAPPTQPGYGPNTRTIMQIVVDKTAPNTQAFSFPSLKAAFVSTPTTAGVFAATQHPIIVPEAAYSTAYNQTLTNNQARIQSTGLSFAPLGNPVVSLSLAAGGSGYVNPTVSITGGGGINATATATAVNGVITDLTLTNGGTGYTSIPVVTISDCAGCAGAGASAAASIVWAPGLLRKTIQELFTADYGRMNATLGTELPLTNFLTQTTIPLAFVDPPTEIFKEGESQLWKITHNGVDTHFIHFHIFDVQVINRVGWDGTVRPPDENEIGWKDTVRMNPLEDIVVALRPVKPHTPWPLPDSIRMLDTTKPPLAAGADANFTGLDPFTNQAAPVANDLNNFGYEYVWHCHILGHEENDMMRSMVFQIPPPTPTNLTANWKLPLDGTVQLAWTDSSANETSFTIQRASDNIFNMGLATTNGLPASLPNTAWGGTMSATDTVTLAPNPSVFYRVQSVDDGFKPPLAQTYNQTAALASPWSNTAQVLAAATTATILAPDAAYGTAAPVTVTVTSPQGQVTGSVRLAVDGGAPLSGTLGGNPGAMVFSITGLAVGTHTLAASYVGIPGFIAGSTATGTLTITPPILTITAGSATMVYGGTVPAITPVYSGFVNGDTIATALTTPATCSTTATSSSAVGSYPSSCSGAVAPNYLINYVAGAVTVTPAPASVTPNAASKAYGTADPVFTGTLTGFLPADAITATYTRTAGETVAGGPYAISATLAPIAALSNYTITYNTAPFTITPVAASVTPNPATKVYGTADPVFTGTLAGFLPADGVTAVFTRTPGETVLGGPYAIGATLAPGAVLTNYTITYNTAPFTITAAAASVTPNPASKVYGSPNPVLTGTLAGFLPADSVVASFIRTTGESVAGSPYTISAVLSPTAVLSNYAIAYNTAAFTITPSPNLTIAANNAVRGVGMPNPTFTVTGTGFAFTDTLASLSGTLVCTTTATTSSPTGTYPITCSGLTSTNYAPITWVPGTLTVTQVLSVTPSSLNFGNVAVGTNSVLSATVQNFTGATLTIAYSITGTNAADFARTFPNTCGSTLAANSSCTLSVRFQPAAALGAETAQLNLAATGYPTVVVPLSGTSTGPRISASPTSLSFGTVIRGQISSAKIVTITNTGTGNLTFNSTNGFSLSGTYASQFRLTTATPCVNGGVLAPTASCTVSVQFAPAVGSTTGFKFASLTIRSNATNGTQTVSLTGTAQ